MKNIFILSAICIISGVILSSCSSNYSIAKRRYTKGYYVEHIKEKPSVVITKQEFTPAEAPKRVALHLLPVKQSMVIAGNFGKTAPERKFGLIGLPEKAIDEVSSRPGASQLQNQNVSISENPLIQSKVASQVSAYEGDGGERAALSLLWIVIVVVLILWLIGLLAGGFGLGGLINILLVIALVLLILWLLRIL